MSGPTLARSASEGGDCGFAALHHRLRFGLVFSAAVLFACSVATADSPLVVPRDGAPYSASLLRIENDGRVMLAVDGQPRTVPADGVVRWGAPAEPKAGAPLVLAADGSVIPFDNSLEQPTIKDEKLLCDTRKLGRVQFPLSALRGVILRPPAQSLAVDLLARQIMTAQGSADQLILDNGDRLSGTITDFGSEKLKLQVEDRPVELAAGNIAAIVFNPSLARTPAQPAQRLMVGLTDGTRLACTPAASEGTTVRLTALGGLELKTGLESVVWLQPLARGVTYLSDLEPAGYRHTPFLTLSWPYYRDANVLGGRLRGGGRAYLKGLGVHSTSLLSYTLDKPYRRLDAEVGIDDETQRRGSVVFRVYVDTGDGQWQRRYESPVIRGGEKPTPISVDLSGAKRIGLLVDLADKGDELDHANWLDARLVP